MSAQEMRAKYDYSRQFSPNVDAPQVELSFRKGDIIIVYGPMDEDGFYLGERMGVLGLVPSNFIEPAVDKPTEGEGRNIPPQQQMSAQEMRAKYDYSRHFSPNVDAPQVELSFRKGDIIIVYGPMDEDGFYLGERMGVLGLVPSNFIEPALDKPTEGEGRNIPPQQQSLCCLCAPESGDEQGRAKTKKQQQQKKKNSDAHKNQRRRGYPRS